MHRIFLRALLLLIALVPIVNAPAQAQTKTDILVLGDSQISFSAGGPYLDFFGNLEARCNATDADQAALATLGKPNVAAIGVRSTSLNSWTARSGRAKGTICDVDKKFGVNAGAFGVNGNPKRRFVQIGQGADYQFCQANTSPLESVVRAGYYDPKLIIFALLGNNAERWASDAETARKDAREMMRQMPDDIACIMLTTAPVFEKKTNDLRMRAQENLRTAFAEEGAQCAFVAGFSTATRTVIEGRTQYFARHSDGRIKDPFHPNASAIRQFLDLNTSAICEAVFEVLE
ncbi:MAG: SGNH/GDSL hydrolase family protein [Pseudomonadota bacterium]